MSAIESEKHLVLSQSFTLNKSCTKQVRIGLKVNDNFKPVVQLYGAQCYRTIEFNAEDWPGFSNQLDHILTFFDDLKEPNQYQTIVCGDVSIHYVSNRSMRYVVLRHTQNECELYMRTVTLQELKRQAAWIDHWLHFLHRLPISGYMNSIASAIADMLQTQLFKGSSDRDYRVIQSFVKNNFNNVYDCCAKAIMHSNDIREFQMMYMFLGEMVNFHFDDLYKLIYKTLSTPVVNSPPRFYGLDTVF